MDKEKAVQKMTEVMAKFVGYTGKVLPDDVTTKLLELSELETQPLAKEIYKTMFENQRLAKELDRPSCQDTGVIQFFVRCGVNFPLIGELEELLREAVLRATREAPLRHNSVETFERVQHRQKRRQRHAERILGDRAAKQRVRDPHLHGGRRL